LRKTESKKSLTAVGVEKSNEDILIGHFEELSHMKKQKSSLDIFCFVTR